MNFVIVDNDFQCLDLVTKLTSEFYHVKLLTSNPSISTKISPSTFLSVAQADISNASEVIQHLSKHDNDPINAILLFNTSSLISIRNIIQSMERFNREMPHLFLIFINQQPDEKLHKLLKESPDTLSWTIICCHEINSSSSSSSRNYQVKTESPSSDQHPVNVDHFLAFIHDEMQTKKYLHKKIFVSLNPLFFSSNHID